MDRKHTVSRPAPNPGAGLAVLLLAFALLLSPPAAVGQPGGECILTFNIELLELNLSGGPYPMPLGPGWSVVESQVTINESALSASLGQAQALHLGREGQPGGTGGGPCEELSNGDQFVVDSFFDVFFDITVTDVDPANNFAGMADGASIVLTDIGPARMRNQYFAAYDASLPNFGLVPPENGPPYIGHFTIEIPLHADLNGNGEDDKIKFTLAQHYVGEVQQFIILPDGTVLDTFDSEAFLEGAIVDESEDPPFTLGDDPTTDAIEGPPLTGPTVASSQLLGVAPRDIKVGLTQDLVDLLPTGDKNDDKRISKAIEHMGNSLDPELWIDPSHVNSKRVFDEERKAVKELMKVQNTDVSTLIISIASADALLAEIAVSEAILVGGDGKELAKAAEELAKAEEAAAAGKPDKAIEHYRKAWQRARKAVK